MRGVYILNVLDILKVKCCIKIMFWRGYFNVLNISNRCSLKNTCYQNISNILSCRYLQYISHLQLSRCCVHSGPKSDISEHDPIIDFESMLKSRRDEAQRSVLVQVQSEQSCPIVHDYCLRFGEIKNLFFYSLQETSHFALVEFSEISSVTKVIQECGHIDLTRVIPVRSPFLWFRTGVKEKSVSSSRKSASIYYKTGRMKPHDSELTEWLIQAETVSDQMLILYRSTCLDDLAIRLRFLTARQVEASIAGIFPVNKCLLFGSSVNGFGRFGCDLDLLIQFDTDSEESLKHRLVFHTKSSLVNSRTQVQRHLETLADLLQLFLPGCSGVRRIFQARVPIMKYKQELTGIDCDLSMCNMTAIYMSELLYTFGNIDWRVRPLVFTIKKWAAEVNLTNPIPGRWITNFSLTILVVFYLQQIKILPSMDDLVKKSRHNDKRISEDGVNCTFLRDVTSLRTNSDRHVSSLVHLLQGFFEYYASFDFNMKAIALNSGIPLPKQDYAPLYIINPLERHLNISKNVSTEETERLKIEFRNATWELESSSKRKGKEWTKPWGLVCLFKGNHYNKKAKDLFSPIRISKSVNLNSVNNEINVKDSKTENINSSGESNLNETKLKGRRR